MLNILGDIQHVTHNIKHLIWNIHRFTYNIQHFTYNVQHLNWHHCCHFCCLRSTTTWECIPSPSTTIYMYCMFFFSSWISKTNHCLRSLFSLSSHKRICPNNNSRYEVITACFCIIRMSISILFSYFLLLILYFHPPSWPPGFVYESLCLFVSSSLICQDFF